MTRLMTIAALLVAAGLAWPSTAALRAIAPMDIIDVYLPLVTSADPPAVGPTAMPSVTPVTPQPTADPRAGCSPAYPTVCIPPPPPDLNCGDIPYRRFAVLPPDPHNFDTDHDGIGCESG